MIIERNGRKCTCGKNGCYEAYASMKVLKTKIRDRLGNQNLSSKEIVSLLKNNDNMKLVEDIIEEYIEYAAIGISNAARICSAEVLVIGGSFIHYKDILFDKLKNELDRIMIPMEKERVEIRLAKFGNDAGIIGAANI